MWGVWRSGQSREEEDDERCDALMVRLQAEIEEAEARSPIPTWDGTSGLTKGSEEELAMLVQATADEERRLRSRTAGARGCSERGGGALSRQRVSAAPDRPLGLSSHGSGSSSTTLATLSGVRRENSRSAQGSPAPGAADSVGTPGPGAALPPRPRSAGSLRRAGSAPPVSAGSLSASSSRSASPGPRPAGEVTSGTSGTGGESRAGAVGVDSQADASRVGASRVGASRVGSGSLLAGEDGSTSSAGLDACAKSSSRASRELSTCASLSSSSPREAAATSVPAPARPPRPRTRAEAMAALRRVDLADVDAVWKALEAALDAEDAAAWGGRVRRLAASPGEDGAATSAAAPQAPPSAAALEEAAVKRCLVRRDLRGAFSHAISGEGACPPGLGRDRRRFSLLAAVLRARRS